MAKDPICGMEVDESTEWTTENEKNGETVYFCSEHCRRKFIAGHRADETTEQQDSVGSATIYTCPMHPEVEQEGPGSCPKCGMDLEPKTVSVDEGDDPELKSMTRRLWISALLSVGVVILAMGEMVGIPVHDWFPPGVSKWIELILATPVVLWGGWPFFQRGWKSIVTWNLNMFTLVALGTGVAWVYSIAAILFPGLFPSSFRNADGMVPLYFEAAAVIITLVLLGQVLELGARKRTSGALRELLRLAPDTARVIRDGSETEVPLDQVGVGDQLRVKPGEKIPVDGVVEEGRMGKGVRPKF